jgi:tetratricopeptide (TPR) repeat protein
LYEGLLPISKADVARLMILLTYGGVYSDLDGVPHEPLAAILSANAYDVNVHKTALFVHTTMAEHEVRETSTFPIRRGLPEISKRISTGFIYASERNSAVLKAALDIAHDRLAWVDQNKHSHPTIDFTNDYTIVYTTGPDVLCEAAFRSRGLESSTAVYKDVLVVPQGHYSVKDAAASTWRGQNKDGKGTCSEADALSSTGHALQNSGRLAEAIDTMQQALALVPNHVPVLNNLGVALGKDGRTEEAVFHLRTCVDLASPASAPFISLAILLARQKQWDRAIGMYRKALAVKPSSISHVLSFAKQLQKRGQIARSCEVFRIVVAMQPTHAAAQSGADLACAMANEEVFCDANQGKVEVTVQDVEEFYRIHNPAKVHTVAKLVAKYDGDFVLEQCKKKYGAVPKYSGHWTGACGMRAAT